MKSYSRILDREMEYALYGDASSGKLCIAFPPQNGRFYDFHNFGMVDTVRPWIDAGRLRIVCPDGIDAETWSDEGGNPRARIELQERWFRYVTDELLPMYAPGGRDAMVCGCSMGGVHAGNFFFRRPDLFDTLLSMSGLFNAQYFFHDYMDDLVYDNSPVHFLPNMPDNHPWMDFYRKSKIILCVGQGAWEEDLLYGTRELDAVLTAKGIPHWADYWGFDVNHDWDWWRKQFPYFVEHILGRP
ncbi:MAG: esterase family protein [Oscillibacter sp.]|nr:esterase family protein [Oscillibacter sp.]